MVAIRALGTCAPRLRVSAKETMAAWGTSVRGIESRAIPGFDEDAGTLAVEAARRAVTAWGGDPAGIACVAFATSGGETASALVAEAVGAASARLLDATGRPTAGVAALVAAFDAAVATGAPALLAVGDVPRAAPGSMEEASAGAAGFACVIAPGEGVRLVAAGAAAGEVPGDRLLDAKGFERRAEVELDDPSAAGRAAADAGAGGPLDFVVASPAGTLVPGPDGKPLAGVRTFPSPRARLGDAGAAAPLLDLAQALAGSRPGTEGMLVARSAGIAQAVRLAVDSRPAGALDAVAEAGEGKPIGYLRALKERGFFLDAQAFPDAPMGAHVPLPDFVAELPARLRLVGSRCSRCDRVAYPPRSACPRCGGGDLAEFRLSGRATLDSYTVIGRGGAPGEFAPQQAASGEYAVGLVAFVEGPRVAAQITDADPEALAIGTPLRPVVRRLYSQGGVVRYGLKFCPGPATR